MEPWIVTAEFLDDEFTDNLSALNIAKPQEEAPPNGPNVANSWPGFEFDDENGESSSWASTRAYWTDQSRQCTACMEQFPSFDIARAPCRHEYCCQCLKDLFDASMIDDSLFPPRCCRQSITPGAVRGFLPAELIKRYEQKKIEFDTPNRTYCSNPRCSSFILPGHANIGNENLTCTQCGTKTCTICKEAAHSGDCPVDTALQQMLMAAEENEWQRCFNCHSVVELDHGCNHITLVSPLYLARSTC